MSLQNLRVEPDYSYKQELLNLYDMIIRHDYQDGFGSGN